MKGLRPLLFYPLLSWSRMHAIFLWIQMGVTSSYGHVIKARKSEDLLSYRWSPSHSHNFRDQTLECCVKNTDRLIEPYGRLGLLREARGSWL
jgi:hypothetical protein